jgi:hypothetical protein
MTDLAYGLPNGDENPNEVLRKVKICIWLSPILNF